MDKQFDIVTTKGGDAGKTSLLDGRRLNKDELVFDALGAVDELNAFLGLARAATTGRMTRLTLHAVQKRMLTIGAELAAMNGDEQVAGIPKIRPADISRLETLESWFLAKTPVERKFILPGDSHDSACLDVARTVCRRAERHIVRFVRQCETDDLTLVMKYLNRLSDLLFIMARFAARHNHE